MNKVTHLWELWTTEVHGQMMQEGGVKGEKEQETKDRVPTSV